MINRCVNMSLRRAAAGDCCGQLRWMNAKPSTKHVIHSVQHLLLETRETLTFPSSTTVSSRKDDVFCLMGIFDRKDQGVDAMVNWSTMGQRVNHINTAAERVLLMWFF